MSSTETVIHMQTSVPPAAVSDRDPTAEAPDEGATWSEFAHVLRSAGDLTTSTLARWTGRPVSIGSLTRERNGRQRRISLVTLVDSRTATLCEATADVRYDLLPHWVRRVLDTTHQPLGRTLYRAGATRHWDCGVVLPAGDRPEIRSSNALTRRSNEQADHYLVVRATFTMPGQGIVATVEETFCPLVLRLRREGFDREAAVERPEQLIDDTDVALLELLRRRRELTRPSRPSDGSAPPAHPVHNDLLLAQLVDAFGRAVGGALFTAITCRVPAASVVKLSTQRDEQSETA